MFTANHRGVANGIFSWGVYYGYGLAFVFGIYITDANLSGYSWRAPYVLAGLPGILISVLILATFRDPRHLETKLGPKKTASEGFRKWIMEYLKKLLRTFCSPSLMILLLAGNLRNEKKNNFV